MLFAVTCEVGDGFERSIAHATTICKSATEYRRSERVTAVPGKGRFDAEAFYAALDAERRSRQETWKKVADEAQVSASTLTRMAQGRRPDVDSLAALMSWSGLSADRFVRNAGRKSEPGALAMISAYIKSDPQLSAEAAIALDEMIKATYERMRKKD